MRIAPHLADALREALRAMIAPSRAEAGCLLYDAHQDANDPSVFVMWETWASVEALELHNQTPHFRELMANFAHELLPPEPRLFYTLEKLEPLTA